MKQLYSYTPPLLPMATPDATPRRPSLPPPSSPLPPSNPLREYFESFSTVGRRKSDWDRIGPDEIYRYSINFSINSFYRLPAVKVTANFLPVIIISSNGTRSKCTAHQWHPAIVTGTRRYHKHQVTPNNNDGIHEFRISKFLS